MLNSMAGHDKKDSTSANLEMPDLMNYLDKGIKGKKIGIPKEYTQDGISKDIVKSVSYTHLRAHETLR